MSKKITTQKSRKKTRGIPLIIFKAENSKNTFTFISRLYISYIIMINSIVTKSSEEFIWATISGSAPLNNEPSFEYNVEYRNGNGNDRNWICKLKPGFIISLQDMTPQRDLTSHVETNCDCLKFSYFLSGKGAVNYNFLDMQLNRSFDDELVHHSYVYFSPEIEGKIRFQAKQRLQQFSINISPLLLLNYFNGQFDLGPHALRDILAGSDQLSFFHSSRISNSMIGVIHQILNCHYTGPMRQLFIESKAMELIVCKFDQIIRAKSYEKKPSGLSIDDIDRIRNAVDILTSNFENPPELSELAKSVGTTHTRLNFGFKKIYGTTAFGYLRRIRLEKAKQLLEKEGFNVTQAAYEVGYNSIPSFSKAFSNHFGMNPTKYIKKLF